MIVLCQLHHLGLLDRSNSSRVVVQFAFKGCIKWLFGVRMFGCLDEMFGCFGRVVGAGGRHIIGYFGAGAISLGSFWYGSGGWSVV